MKAPEVARNGTGGGGPIRVSSLLAGRGISCGRIACEMISCGGFGCFRMGSGVDGGKKVSITALGAAVSLFARASFCCFVTNVILLIPELMLSRSSPTLSTVVWLALAIRSGLDDLEVFLRAAVVDFLARGAFGRGFLLGLAVLVFFTARGPPAVVLTLMEVSGLSVIDDIDRSLIGAENIDSPSRYSVMVDAALRRLPCIVCARPLGCGVLLRDPPCEYVNKTIGIRSVGIQYAYLLRSKH